MNAKRSKWMQLFGLLVFAAMASFLAGSASAQQTQQKSNGAEEIQVQYNHSKVVLVEGNHLVTKTADGKLEAVFVPDDFQFHMGDQALSVHELKPGMTITETVTTTTKPELLTTVEVTGGTIWHVAGDRVTIKDANNKLHTYVIPPWSKVQIYGERLSVYNLKAGMAINTTIFTEKPITIAEVTSKTTVTPAPEPPKKAEPEPAVEQPAQEAAPPPEPQPAPAQLPKTASPIPLIGLLGLLSLAASFGFRVARKSL
jgi:hypothetical protein